MKTFKEKLEDSLEVFKRMVPETIEHMFQEDGEVEPTVFVLIQDGNKISPGILKGLGPLFASDEGKDAVVKIIREFSKEQKVLALAFASEGWVSEYPAEDADKVIDEHGNYRANIVRPSEDPNRKEVLFVNFETPTQENKIVYNIVRVPGLDPKLKVEITSKWGDKKEFGGRFDNILRENYETLVQDANEQIKKNLN